MTKKINMAGIINIIIVIGLFISGRTAYPESRTMPSANPKQSEPEDLVTGNLIQFNDNGSWCWYQDERAVVDMTNGKLIIGSDASAAGTGGSSRNGQSEGVIFNLPTREPEHYSFKTIYCDDHNTPAFLIRPDGKYLTFYAAHNSDNYSYFRIYDSGTWGTENLYDWNTMPGGTNFHTTYSNLFYLSSENIAYNFARTDERSPNFIYSRDQGDRWAYGGELTSPDVNVGYVNGYFKYSSNGTNRIDFICTEHHPRDYNTSMYHGYIQGGQSFQSDGTLIDDDIFDKVAPYPTAFTPIFLAGTTIGDMTMNKVWNADLQVYEDGTIAAILTARINNNVNGNDTNIDPDHAFIYCRYNGTSWSYTYLGQAGKKLYGSEADYTGLGALNPYDPNTIYISTHIDPVTDEDITFREIFKGHTDDNGVTWTWTPVTQNSNQHNIRPIIPKWDANHTALLWLRGIYNSAQSFDASIVGIIETSSETIGLMHYTDATAANTTFSDGSPLVTTGPDGNQGAADDQWHERTGYGNGNSVLTSAEAGGENAPQLKTAVTVPETGIYDVWVNFWANPTEDWRIKAGLSGRDMQLYRQMACKQVEERAHDVTIVLIGDGNTFLYQAYLGRIEISDELTFEALVDDDAVQTGTTNTLIGGTARTWYDGISYARVNSEVSVSKNERRPIGFSLSQNYPNPFNPTTTITFSVPEKDHVSLRVFNMLGREVATLLNQDVNAGNHTVTWEAQNITSGVYLYKIVTNHFVSIKKCLYLK